jgi:hypothetical protein
MIVIILLLTYVNGKFIAVFTQSSTHIGQESVEGIYRGLPFESTQSLILRHGRVRQGGHGSEQRIPTCRFIVLSRQGVCRGAGGKVERIVRSQEFVALKARNVAREELQNGVSRILNDLARGSLGLTWGSLSKKGYSSSRHHRTA